VRYTYDLTLLRNGANDPTTRISVSPSPGSPIACIERATLTPHGPGSIRVTIDENEVLSSDAWGAGAEWLKERVKRLSARHASRVHHSSGEHEPVVARHTVVARHPAVRESMRRFGHLLLPASDTPYHELLPAILGQRITAAQALTQWKLLCERYGDTAPGPLALRLPPSPERLKSIPSWEFHRLGIEEQRARTLHTAARYASYIDRTRELEGPSAREALMRLPGIGIWTAAVTVGVSHGDPDALPVGDFHVKNTVAWALTGRPRGTDEEMLATLAAYAGQRWRVVRLLERAGFAAPRFAPKRRLLDVASL
jgi:3-methyladenine DNA glycosylase/8-oxoguanine DNA glycosylase